MSDNRRAAPGGDGASAVARLPELKRTGCNVLVTGTVSETTLARATRRLFGAADLDRTRVLVRTASGACARDFLPATVDSDSSSVVRFDIDAYEAASNPLAALCDDVVAAADDFAAGSRRPVGSEFRLSVTSLDGLLTASDARAVGRFLDRTTGAVTDVRGMGHYCYDGPRSALSALPLDRLFDGFVELRDRSRAEHRLRLPQSPPTDWTDL